MWIGYRQTDKSQCMCHDVSVFNTPRAPMGTEGAYGNPPVRDSEGKAFTHGNACELVLPDPVFANWIDGPLSEFMAFVSVCS